MNDRPSSASENHAPRGLPDRVLPVIAWVVVAASVLFKLAGPSMGQNSPPEPDQPSQESSLADAMMTLQAKLVLATTSFSSELSEQDKKALANQLRALETGSVHQRQQVAVLSGVVLGHPAAEGALTRLEQATKEAGVELTATQQLTNRLLERMFASGGTPLSSAESQEIESALGWFGTLGIAATQPDRQSQRKAFVNSSLQLAMFVAAAFVGLIVMVLLGATGLVVGIVQVARGRIRALGASPTADGIWIEAFACWMVLFMFLLPEVLGGLPGFWSSLLLFPVSLVAVLWFPLRGLPLRIALRDLGWHRGTGWWREVAAGVSGYAMMLPLLAIGLAGTLLLMWMASAFDSSEGPTFDVQTGAAHPIIAFLQDGSLGQLLAVFTLAVLMAPLLEETVFRGILYRHLRDASRRLQTWVSIGCSSLLSGFIFAAIHPQGWVAIPTLGVIGVALALAREWRSSLIAPMIMHGINNGLVLLSVLLIFRI